MHGYMLREKYESEKRAEPSETIFESLSACIDMVVIRARDRPGDKHEWTILKRVPPTGTLQANMRNRPGSENWTWLPIASSDTHAVVYKTKIVE